VIVVPEKDVVIVLTEASFTNGKPQRGLIWDKFLPALSDQPLPASKDYELLKKKQAAYTLEIPAGKENSAMMKKIIGKKVIIPKKNIPVGNYSWKEVSFEKVGKQLMMNIVMEDGTSYTQQLGYKTWGISEIAGFPPYSLNPIDWKKGLEGPFYAGGSYGWEKNTLNTSIHFVNWVTSIHISWKFAADGKSVVMSITNNLAKNKVVEVECEVK
jgi:hypothetical protein